MAQSTLTVGIILTVALLIVSLIILKATPKDKFAGYILPIIVGLAGLAFLFTATVTNTEFLGAPLGGWGIASLFSAAITFIITSIADSFANETQTQ